MVVKGSIGEIAERNRQKQQLKTGVHWGNTHMLQTHRKDPLESRGLGKLKNPVSSWELGLLKPLKAFSPHLMLVSLKGDRMLDWPTILV